MTDAPELFVEFREGGKICVWDFDNGSIPYVRKDLLDIAIARAEVAEAENVRLREALQEISNTPGRRWQRKTARAALKGE